MIGSVNYLSYALPAMRHQRLAAVEVKPEVQARFNADLQAHLRGASGYLDKHGENTTRWPSCPFLFRRQTRRFDLAACDTTPQPVPVPVRVPAQRILERI